MFHICYGLLVFARKNAHAAAIQNNKNANQHMFHYFHKYSQGRMRLRLL